MPTLSSAGCGDKRLEAELRVSSPIGKGKTKGARLVQELLGLQDINIAIDGDYGPATQAGLDRFCKREGIGTVTQVDQGLMDRLAQPLLRAIQPVADKAKIGETIVAIARQHVKERPIEVGGANGGPWVRLYMKGQDGPNFLWCAGFVSYIVAAAAKAHGKPVPVVGSQSCDTIAADAKQRGIFRKRVTPSTAGAGSLFLVPSQKHASDWIHTGIITGLSGNGHVFETIEGNTNQGGSRNGFEACIRTRACAKVDVVTL